MNEIGRNHQRTGTTRGTRIGGRHLGIAGCIPALLTSILPPACGEVDREAPGTADIASGEEDHIVLADQRGTAGQDDATLVDAVAFREAFEVARSLVLEERDVAMVVLPMVSRGTPDEFLLAEPQEGQVNVYDTAGRLLRVIGRRGEGPGEFNLPVAAKRTVDGGIVVADAALSRLTFFPPEEALEPEVVSSPLPVLLGAQDLGNGKYLLSGQSMAGQPPRLLHIWERATEAIERSFMPMGAPDESRPYAASYTSVDAVLEDDTIWAVWALSDTLYKFDRGGSVLERFPLALPRPMGTLPGREAGVITDPGEVRAAAESITQVNGVFILGDGALAVQTMQVRGFDAVWDLLIVDRNGAPVWSAARMPRLFAVVGDRFYFDDPASLLPNHWVVAGRRGEGEG